MRWVPLALISGWDAPWFVAQVSDHMPGDEASPEMGTAQASLWKDGVALGGPDRDALSANLATRVERAFTFESLACTRRPPAGRRESLRGLNRS